MNLIYQISISFKFSLEYLKLNYIGFKIFTLKILISKNINTKNIIYHKIQLTCIQIMEIDRAQALWSIIGSWWGRGKI